MQVRRALAGMGDTISAVPARPSRRALVAALFVGGAAALAGCTLLIPFDEVAVTDAGTDSAVPPLPDARTDTSVPLGDGGVNDATNYDACTGAKDGYYCGGDQIAWPGKDDQIACKTGKVAVVRHCTTGQGCLGMLDGYPDECDECSTKADGTYCGRDFATWQTKNAEQRVRCQGGREVGLLLCGTCVSNGANSACQ